MELIKLTNFVWLVASNRLAGRVSSRDGFSLVIFTMHYSLAHINCDSGDVVFDIRVTFGMSYNIASATACLSYSVCLVLSLQLARLINPRLQYNYRIVRLGDCVLHFWPVYSIEFVWFGESVAHHSVLMAFGYCLRKRQNNKNKQIILGRRLFASLHNFLLSMAINLSIGVNSKCSGFHLRNFQWIAFTEVLTMHWRQ